MLSLGGWWRRRRSLGLASHRCRSAAQQAEDPARAERDASIGKDLRPTLHCVELEDVAQAHIFHRRAAGRLRLKLGLAAALHAQVRAHEKKANESAEHQKQPNSEQRFLHGGASSSTSEFLADYSTMYICGQSSQPVSCRAVFTQPAKSTTELVIPSACRISSACRRHTAISPGRCG